MADTQRTITAIQTLLADNTAGDISAQDLRDVVETLRPRFGKMAVQAAGSAAVTISDTTSYFEATAPTWTLSGVATGSPDAANFDMNTNGRLRYTGTVPIVANVTMSVAVTSGSTNQVIYYRLGKNGTTSANSEMHRKISTGSDVGALAIGGIFELDTNDYVSVFVRNTTGANNITVEVAQLQAVGFTL